MSYVTVISGTKDKPSEVGEKPIILGADKPPERNLLTRIFCGDLDQAQREAAAARKNGQSLAITTSELKIRACGYQLPPKGE